MDKIAKSPNEFAEIIKHYGNIVLFPVCILLICFNIKNKKCALSYTHPGDYPEGSLKYPFKEAAGYFCISFIILIFSILLILMNTSFEMTVIDSDVIVPPGSEKTVNMSIDCSSEFCRLLDPTIVLEYGELPNGVNISFMITKGSPRFSSMLTVKASDNAHEYQGPIHIYGHWGLFSSICEFFEINENKTNLNLRIPKLVAISANRTNPQVAGTVIAWTARVSRNLSNSSLIYVFKKNSLKINESNGTWIWRTNQEDKGRNLIEVELYKNKTLLGKSDPMVFIILENEPPKIIEIIQQHPECNFFTVKAEDPENDEIYYKFLIRKKGSDRWRPIKEWGESSSWAQNISLNGDHELKVMVRDDMHLIEEPKWIGSNVTRDIEISSADEYEPHEIAVTKPEEIAVTKPEEIAVTKPEEDHQDSEVPDRYDTAKTLISIVTSES